MNDAPRTLARPRDAASVVLLRGERDRPQVLMGRRRRRASFLPEVYVFPGGRVESSDRHAPPGLGPRAETARLLRRHGAEVRDQQAPLTIGELTIHPGKRAVRYAGQPVRLTAAEFAALQFLARQPGWVFTRNQLVAAVHGPDYPVTDRSIDVLIAGVRKKLGAGSGLIETVRGVGYRFSEPEP